KTGRCPALYSSCHVVAFRDFGTTETYGLNYTFVDFLLVKKTYSLIDCECRLLPTVEVTSRCIEREKKEAVFNLKDNRFVYSSIICRRYAADYHIHVKLLPYYRHYVAYN
ncbi:MAG: hypothetical protein Q4G48_08030, partial [Bacteroidia bacterium]|nr:hypothetical protein [Bacteroidia bacterium]